MLHYVDKSAIKVLITIFSCNNYLGDPSGQATPLLYGTMTAPLVTMHINKPLNHPSVSKIVSTEVFRAYLEGNPREGDTCRAVS